MSCGFIYHTSVLPDRQVAPPAFPTDSTTPPTLSKPTKTSYTIPKNPSFKFDTTKREITNTISISSISIPLFSMMTQLSFTPTHVSVTTPQIPNPLVVRDIPPINYEKFKIPISFYDNIIIPFSISFPDLPLSQDVVIPDLNERISIETNDLSYINGNKYQFNFLLSGNMNYDVKGTFIRNNGMQLEEENLFMRERNYFKGLINSFMDKLDTISNIDFLFLQLSNHYMNESNEFYRHLSSKERALLKVELTMKIYKEVLNYKINRLATLLNQAREKASLFISANKELLSLWEGKQSIKDSLYKNFIDKVKKDANLYNIVSKVNSDMRELFYFYNNLLIYSVESIALNIERERLLIELSMAMKEIDVAKSKEQLPPLKIELLKNQIKTVEERYKKLILEASTLSTRLNSSIAKKDSYNANLLATKAEIDISVTKLNNRSDTLYMDYDIRLLERVMNNYVRMIEEYYSIMRSVWASYYDSKRYGQLGNIANTLYNSTLSKISNIRRNFYDLAQAYAFFVNAHAWASQMIANANITSNVIESYR